MTDEERLIIGNREKQWLKVRAFMKSHFNKAPQMEGILYLVGLNVLGGNFRKQFSKEEKQDLMHIATCYLLAPLGYFKYDYTDTDGWPHYVALQPLPMQEIGAQEDLLKDAVILYFKEQGLI